MTTEPLPFIFFRASLSSVETFLSLRGGLSCSSEITLRKYDRSLFEIAMLAENVSCKYQGAIRDVLWDMDSMEQGNPARWNRLGESLYI